MNDDSSGATPEVVSNWRQPSSQLSSGLFNTRRGGNPPGVVPPVVAPEINGNGVGQKIAGKKPRKSARKP